MKRNKLALASLRLKSHIFEGCDTGLNAPGFVGIGQDTIHAYLHCSRKRWAGPRPAEWEGYPVIWHYGVGPTVAQFDRVTDGPLAVETKGE